MRLTYIVGITTLAAVLFACDAFAQRFGGSAGGVRAGGGYRGGGAVAGPSFRGATRSAGSGFQTPFGAGASGAKRTTTSTPFGSSTRATQGFSHTTNRGYTVSGGATAGVKTGPLGGAKAGGAGGVRVTTPAGQSYSKDGTRHATVGPAGGTSVGGSRVRGTTGPRGTAVQGGRAGAAIGPRGGAVAGAKGGAAATRFPTDQGLARYSAARVGTTGRARYGTTYRSSTYVRSRGVNVRRSYVHRGVFSAGWYTRHPRCWRPVRWRPAVGVWTVCTWPILVRYCGFPSYPVYYDYGTTVVYQGDTVYVQGNPAGATTEYAQQAATIAEQGTRVEPAKEEEWQSLGVFAMVQGDEENANQIFQLAINKSGIIRGNYYNALTDTTVPVRGSADAKSQRAAWTVGDKKTPVYEAGIANLTKDETTMMVHFGDNNSQQWMLVRLEEPKEK